MYDRGDESDGYPVIVSRSNCLVTLAKHSSKLAVRLTLRVREALGAAISHLFYDDSTIIGQDLYRGGLRSIKQDRRMW